MSIDEKKLHNDFEAYLRGEDPPPDELATAPRIDQWVPAISRGPDGNYRMTLVGMMIGHPTLTNGRRIETSPLVWIDGQSRWARTMSRVYVLGEPAGARESEV
ncbi:hypothetical protein V1294_006054 [Bradyrhizobium sp. AZCC 1678]|uniref:DUF6634 family protein n=1 Tax=Bradyrhizobium sp. AZCC 1678 TaxID=3117030 RepID=UPI002FEF0FBA